MTLPIVSIVTDDRYFNDDKIGIYVEGTYSDKQSLVSNKNRTN